MNISLLINIFPRSGFMLILFASQVLRIFVFNILMWTISFVSERKNNFLFYLCSLSPSTTPSHLWPLAVLSGNWEKFVDSLVAEEP